MAANDSMRICALPLRSLAFGGIGATYTPVGAAAGDSVRILQVWNTTDQLLLFSEIGDEDNFPLPANSGMVLDVTTNRTNTAQTAALPSNVRIHVKHDGTPPTSGSVYVTYWVGDNR